MSACVPGLPVYAAVDARITGNTVVVVTAPHLLAFVTLFDDQGAATCHLRSYLP